MLLCTSRGPERFACRWLLAALLLAWVAALSPAATPPPQASGYTLVFSDDFTSLDLSADGTGNHTWYDGVWFYNNPAPLANISAANSALSLVWQSSQKPDDTSIETYAEGYANYHVWRYGYFEARMKWDVVKGAWPAFWLTPVETALGQDFYNGVQEQGEFDIFEGQGDQPHSFFGTVHDWVNGKGTANTNNTWTLASSVDFSQYHTYGMLWLPGKVTWYFDDQPLMSAPTPAVVDKQTYLMILGMQEGAGWQYGNLSGVTASSMTLAVDWVHVWQPQAASAPVAASANFTGIDTTTRGNWKGVYGADGSLIANDSSHIPAYASVTPASGTPVFTWLGSTADSRALLKYQSTFDHIASTYYNYPGFNFDINFTDGQAHRVAFYCLDWDNGGRSQTITITDAVSGATLDSRSAGNFQNGQYVVWSIAGHVQVQFKQLAGQNAIVNGLFFDTPGGISPPSPPAVTVSFNAPAANQTVAGTVTLSANASSAAGIASVQYQVDGANLTPLVSAGPPYLLPWDSTKVLNGSHTLKAIATDNGAQQASAAVMVNVSNVATPGGTAVTFVKRDTVTKGSWKGVYGQDGEIIANDSSVLPGYAAASALSGATPFTWTITQDPKALQEAIGTLRTASTFYAAPGFTLDLNLTDGNAHQFAAYLLDWDSGGRTETVTLRDAVTQSVLDSETAAGFTQGLYLVWKVKGHVTVQFSLTAGANAVVSGVFLGSGT